jgi:hypothetical protein
VYYFLTKLILKILNTIKGYIQSNLKVPHPIFVALGISIATTVIVVVSIFYISDTGIMRIEDAEAITKFKPKDDGD